MLTVNLFNGFNLQYHGTPLTLPSQGSRALFAYCAAHTEQSHTRSRLAGQFWPDLPEATARRRLSHALWEIGQILPEIQGAAYLIRTGDTLGFNRDLPHKIDAFEFRRCWVQAQAANTLLETRRSLQQAATLYTGDFLAGFYEDWCLVEQEQLRDVYLLVLQQWIDVEKAVGDYATALHAARALIAADPLRESAYQEAMRLSLQMGQPHAAHALYAECRLLFQSELGVDPAPETTAILEGGAALPPQLQDEALAFSGEDLPLVGRTQERQHLLRHLDETRHGQGGIVLLAGEAGVGKSRLLRAMAGDATWRSMTVLWGQTQDQSSDTPFAPLLAALSEGLSPLRAQQLAALLDSLWISVAGRILPELTNWLPDVDPLPVLPADQERIRILEGIARVVLALGEIAPLLLIVEDIHWADEGTFDLLTYLAQRLVTSPVLLAVSYRPEEARARVTARDGIEAVDGIGVRRRIHLAPLSREETADLVQRGLGLEQPPALFAARLHTETGGNPLFVLESLRTLHAEGLLARDETGEWTTPYDADTADYIELPLSPMVSRTISRRLSHIDDEARGVLAAAAVLGNEVALPLLDRISDQPGRLLLRALGGLTRHNLLQETATAYRFTHDIVRETVYGELPQAARQALHLRVGRALAEDARAAPATTAFHFAAGAAWHEAAAAYWRAAQSAVNLHSYRTALAQLDRVNECCACGGQLPVPQFDLLLLREDVSALLGDRAAQQSLLHELERLTGDDGPRLLIVHQRFGRLLNEIGDHAAAVARLEAGLALARAQQDALAEAHILALLGQTLYWQGALQAAIPILDQAIACVSVLALESRGEPAATTEASVTEAAITEAATIEADAHTTLAGILNDLSEHARATQAAQRAIELFRQTRNIVGEADVLATLGAVAMEQGRLDEADAYFSQALPVIRASGYRYAEARCLVNWGSIDYLRGRLGRALDRFRQGAQIFREVGSDRGAHFTDLNIAATVSTYIGPDPEAEQLARQAQAAFIAQANSSAVAQAAGILGQFAFLRGDFDGALAHYAECLRDLQIAPDPWVETQAYQARAVVQLGRKDFTAAQEDIEAGLALCAQYGFDDLAPLLWALKGRALLGLGRSEEALAACRTAGVGNELAYGAHIIHYNRHLVLAHCGEFTAALDALQQAHVILTTMLATLTPEDQAQSRQAIPEHRAILAAWESYRPVTQTVRLPRVDAPLGRALEPAEEIEITWVVETPEDRTIRTNTVRRRQQITRLLHQAQACGAIPAYRHLADALQVSERTILRDMAALKESGCVLPPTRGE